MGYEITMVEADVTIPKENENDAMKALMEHDGEFDWQGQSFDDLDPESRGDTVSDVLNRLRFKTEMMDEGTRIKRFTGQKIGSEEKILSILAPYLEDGDYLHFKGKYDDGEWRWQVDGDDVVELTPEKTWVEV